MAYRGPYIPYNKIISMPNKALDEAIRMVTGKSKMYPGRHFGGLNDIALCVASEVINIDNFDKKKLRKRIKCLDMEITIQKYIEDSGSPLDWVDSRVTKVNKDGTFVYKYTE